MPHYVTVQDDAIDLRLQFINEFQRRIRKHCGKIIKTIGEPLELEKKINDGGNNTSSMERIEILAKRLENLYREKIIYERKKQENCPAFEIIANIHHDGNDDNNNYRKQAIKLFKTEYKKRVLAEREENERIRRKETLIEKLKKVEYYERKNQQMKWSSLYSGVEGDEEKQNGFLDLENVEKEISALVNKYNDIYHNKKTKKTRTKFYWNEPVMVNQTIQPEFSIEPEDVQTDTFEKTLPSLFKVGENQFTAPTVVSSSNFLEDSEMQIDTIMLHSCLELKYLKKLRQVNTDSKKEVADDTFVYGSSFIRFPLDSDNTKEEPKAIKFSTKVQKIREAIMSNKN
ncbi:predicted protein [Naegleria gruberi]|uniref:Predicted protein n=1 Tax=Naegleria gruberi TaxID=5762 RepID=D2VDR5_NAEGR|nr:uncharacterized protein NAEGRDRAFT_48720 [Naegleria gruberi]EFC45046.1 predicted protein [Naegleria gruberi]|eukprot:XP_002677790.1 predicted protein [Naegleria gruberi strain NEG-M]